MNSYVPEEYKSASLHSTYCSGYQSILVCFLFVLISLHRLRDLCAMGISRCTRMRRAKWRTNQQKTDSGKMNIIAAGAR